jgi:adenylyltransferase/sulfurtransferase
MTADNRRLTFDLRSAVKLSEFFAVKKEKRKPNQMPTLRIPTPLRAYTSGKSEVTVTGANIADALTDLTTQYPAIKPHLFNEGSELRPFVNLFVGESNIKDLQGVDTPIKDGDRIMLIPSIAGG